MTAFYRRLDAARFSSSGLTRGPWSDKAQHGGPPSALLGTRMALLAPEGLRASRLTFELLRPVGLVPLRVEVGVVRAGQQVAWLDGTLWAEGPRGEVAVVRARGVWVRVAPGSAPSLIGSAVPGPEHAVPLDSGTWRLPWHEGYHTAMAFSFVPTIAEGGAASTRTAWIRPLVALVEGEAWTPLGRVLAAVDSIGGACARLPLSDWSFVNADTTCHLLREPEGEHVALEGTQWVEPDGVGLAEARLHDTRGPIGHGLQSQVVGPRAR